MEPAAEFVFDFGFTLRVTDDCVARQIAFYVWTWREWGSIAGPQLQDGLPFTLAAFKNGLVGLWIDRQSGLLAYAPTEKPLAAAVRA